MTLEAVVATSSIVLCCGTGGVGKTTTAASIALHGARRGRRCVVVTIDPAKRLADALGLEGLTNSPSKIDGDWSGELWAMMLDTKTTFDEPSRNSTDPADRAHLQQPLPQHLRRPLRHAGVHDLSQDLGGWMDGMRRRDA
jgi:anion-transporting  ArsA/GET3 family ATPase